MSLNSREEPAHERRRKEEDELTPEAVDGASAVQEQAAVTVEKGLRCAVGSASPSCDASTETPSTAKGGSSAELYGYLSFSEVEVGRTNLCLIPNVCRLYSVRSVEP